MFDRIKNKFFNLKSGSRLFGLMVTRNDHLILKKWLAEHASIFHKIAVVDGSDCESTRELCENYLNIEYTKDPDTWITDQTLRASGWELLKGYVSYGDWIMLCHPDEFYIHDPRQCMSVEANVVRWNALHVLPHTSEKTKWLDSRPDTDVTTIFKHYWWHKSGRPTRENRMFRIVKAPKWDLVSKHASSSVLPKNYTKQRTWDKYPSYFHYKVWDLRPSKYLNGEDLDSRLNTGMGCFDGSVQLDDFFFDENNPYGYKGFVNFSSDPNIPQFDDFNGEFRLNKNSD
jgi:hypothetical protein